MTMISRVRVILLALLASTTLAQAQDGRVDGSLGVEYWFGMPIKSSSGFSSQDALAFSRYDPQRHTDHNWLFINRDTGVPGCPLNGVFEDSDKTDMLGLRGDLTYVGAPHLNADGSSTSGLLGLGANLLHGKFRGAQTTAYFCENAWIHQGDEWYSDVWGSGCFQSDFNLDLYVSTISLYAGLQWESAPGSDGGRLAGWIKGGPGAMIMYGDLDSTMNYEYCDRMFGYDEAGQVRYRDSGWQVVPELELRAGLKFGGPRFFIEAAAGGILPLDDGEFRTTDVIVRAPDKGQVILAATLSAGIMF
jgi:hypothetical protein